MKCNTVNGKCSKCGECCGITTPITSEELLQLKELYTEEVNVRYSKYLEDAISKSNSLYLMCPFLDYDTKKCMIYENRPSVCETFSCNRNTHENVRVYLNKFGIKSNYSNHMICEVLPDCEVKDIIVNYAKLLESGKIKAQ